MTTSPISTTPSAATAAAEEAAQWMRIARDWHPGRQRVAQIDLTPSEASVVALFDPADELTRRAKTWSYEMTGSHLSDLARFAAALARAESDAWLSDRGHIATRAYQDRRFLLGDRILHWAIPWFDAVARQYPSVNVLANDTKDQLLRLGELHRPAPALSGTEGLVVPGFDGYGPLDISAPFEELMLSIWSGSVLLNGYLGGLFGEPLTSRQLPRGWDSIPGARRAIEATYRASATRWDELAERNHGTAQLWRDLANRARRSATVLARWKPLRDISDEVSW
ncbi:MAG: hypothetical protein ACN4GK_06930 [Acidimicrobiia bacterium]